MSQTLTDQLTSTPEGMALFQQERLILEVTELICGLMDEQRVSRAELARRLKTSRAHVTQILDGGANMTLRTVADALTALGCSLHVSSAPLAPNSPARGPDLLTYSVPEDLADYAPTAAVAAVRAARPGTLAAQLRLTA